MDRFRELGDNLINLFIVSDFLISPSLKCHFNGIHYFNFESNKLILVIIHQEQTPYQNKLYQTE
jgi:hypothetical protein